MNKSLIVLTITFICIGTVQAQTINWSLLTEEEPNYVHFNAGYDFGVTTQFGYSRYIDIGKPALLTIDYSFPMGHKWMDDFKFRFGGQLNVLQWNSFEASLKLLGTFKRYESDLVRIADFGTESSVIIGYYQSGWHVGSELGLIKPFLSNLKHSGRAVQDYPSIQNGWFKSPGGYYQYGIQLGKSIGSSFDISIRAGSTGAFGDDKNAILPYYGQLNVLKRL